MEENQGHSMTQGWRLVILVFVISLSFSGVTLVMTVIDGAATKQLIIRGSRFLLTVILCIGMYRGRHWARYVMGLFCLMGALAAIAMAARAGWTTPRGLTSIGLAAIFAPLAVVLVKSGSVREFINSRRRSLCP